MIDLRSDTVTLPTEEMREAMRRAELGDNSREGDPTVRRLEELAAAKTGKEAGLFVASGTMSNLVALLAHTGRGGEVLLDGDCHILRSEMGGVASLAGLFYRPIPSHRGAPDLGEIAEHLAGKLTANKLGTALVTVETTHNSAGGAAIPLDYMAKLRALTAEKGVPVHIDGARVFNAAVAQGVPAAEIAKHGDSVGFCVSKGLSAPFGSVLCGSAAFIEKARAYRRMVGGGMRQAGVMAAAGIVALETHGGPSGGRSPAREAPRRRTARDRSAALRSAPGRDQHRDDRARPHHGRREGMDGGARSCRSAVLAPGAASRCAWSRTATSTMRRWTRRSRSSARSRRRSGRRRKCCGGRRVQTR